MQVLNRHKILVLVSLLLIIVLTISIVFFVENIPKPSSNPTPSPTPSPSPSPTGSTPSNTHDCYHHLTSITTSRHPAPPTILPTITPILLPGEVGAYQGQSLTSISVYLQYLITHPDVAIAGTQSINRETYRLAITGSRKQYH